MRDTKKTLTIAGAVCLVASILSLFEVLGDLFFYDFYWYYLTSDAYSFIASLVTGIIYLSLRNKSHENLTSKKSLFVVILIANIFNGLVVWLVSFWVEIVISELQRVKFFTNVKYNKDTEDDHETIVIEPSDFEVTSKVDLLENELKKLDELKRKKMITEEEYERLKQELLNKFM